MLNSPATFFATAMECWEEDGIHYWDVTMMLCTYTTCGFFNSDDGHAPAGGGNGSTGNTGEYKFHK